MPIPAVLAIYAQENGQGMAFGQEPGVDLPPDTPPEEPTNNKEPSTKKPHLKVVK
jgi:stringent starvation protein B